jgi:hypothetical protein
MKHIALIIALVAATSAQAADTISPGQWQTVSKTTDFVMPGMPAGMSQKLGRGITVSRCITPAEVKDNPRALFEASKGKCTYSKFNMAGGKIESVAVCAEAANKMTISSTGTYTATTYAMDMTMVSAGKQGGVTIKTKVTGKHLGDCAK